MNMGWSSGSGYSDLIISIDSPFPLPLCPISVKTLGGYEYFFVVKIHIVTFF